MVRRSDPSAAPVSRPAGTRWDGFLVALSLLVLTSVWRLQDLFPILATAQVPTLAAVASLALFIIDKDPRRRLKRISHPVVKCAILIMFFAIASVPGGVYPGYSFSFILKDYDKTFMLLILVAAGLRDRKDIERLMWVSVFGATLYSFMVITRIPVGADGRLGDLYYYDANDLGMLIVMTIPMIVFFARGDSKPALRIGAALCLPVLMVALMKTGSRGGFLGLIAVSLFMVWRYRAVSKTMRLSAVAVMAVLFLAFGSDRYWTMMSTMLHPSQDYNFQANVESGRMEIWKRGMGYMMSYPLTGVGANAFPAAEGMISPLAARQSVGIGLKWSAAHNSFVEIGAELGIPGLLLFLAVLIQAGLSLRSPRRRRGAPPLDPNSPDEALAQTLAACLMGFCVSGFFLSQAYSTYLYTLLGMIATPGRRPQPGAGAPVTGAMPVGVRRDSWRVGVPRFGRAR